MATAVIERNADGQVTRHQCPRCEKLVAAERVQLTRFNRVIVGGQPARERRVVLFCDHCDMTFRTIDRRYL